MASGSTITGHMGDKAIQDIVGQQCALLNLSGSPNSPLVFFLCDRGIRRRKILHGVGSTIKHSAMACPEETQRPKYLASGANHAILRQCPIDLAEESSDQQL